jgi:hypothetical protein
MTEEQLLIDEIKRRRYEFLPGKKPERWYPGRCADYCGRGFTNSRCKYKDGHGLGGLFCKCHAKMVELEAA